MFDQFFKSSEADGVLTLTLDLAGSPVNLLKTEVMEALDSFLASISARTDLHLLVIRSAKPGIFVAGADINEIKDLTDAEAALQKVRLGQAVLNRIEMLPFPSVAYIDGACMGGGTELALACTFRFASDDPKTKIALPEVNLGIMPGFGGTQRLPRLVDLAQSLGIILTGRPVDARKAEKIGLVDRIVPSGYFDFFLGDFSSALASGVPPLRRRLPAPEVQSSERPDQSRHLNARRKWQGSIRSRFLAEIRPRRRGKPQLPKKPWFTNRFFLGRAIVFAAAKRSLLHKTGGNYPAPIEALATVRSTLGGSFFRGLAVEAERFSRLAISELSKDLIRIYFLSEAAKKSPPAESLPGAAAKAGSSKPVTQIRRAGVVGAGVMGGGIAWLFANGGFPTALRDVSWEAVQKGYAAAQDIYRQLKKIRKADNRTIGLGMHRISGTLDNRNFVTADLVVEAVVENVEVKRKVVAELENFVAPGAIIATNTSSISLDEIAADMRNPGRLVGMHFFNPVNRMPLVEVILGSKTDPEAALAVAALANKLKKTPVYVKNGPGFLVNRILMPYLNEAAHYLDPDFNYPAADRLWKSWGMPMGPFTLIDEIGIDVCTKVAKILENAFPDRMRTAPALQLLKDNPNLLGKKNGQGFYIYKNGKKLPNPAMRRAISSLPSPSRPLSKQDIIERPFLMMVNEALRCLNEGIVADPGSLDLAMIMGTGFPPFRGGLLRYAARTGLDTLEKKSRTLAAAVNERFTPPEGLYKLYKDKL